MRKFLVVAVAMTVFSVAGSAGVIAALTPCARVNTLSDLTGSGFAGCQIGDKQFTNFGNTTGTIEAIPDNWTVLIFTSSSGAFVVDFAQGFEGDSLEYPAGPWGVSYDVKVDSEMCDDCVISSVGLSINPGSEGAGNVHKTIKNSMGDIIGSATASAPGLNPTSFSLLPPSTWIHVEEVVTLTGQNSVLSSFTDSYRQAHVPEPATYGMMGLGLAALGLISRRKKV